MNCHTHRTNSVWSLLHLALASLAALITSQAMADGGSFSDKVSSTSFTVGGNAITLAPAATVSSFDDFRTVTVAITSNRVTTEDVLAIAPGGSISVSGSNVSYNSTVIGTFSGGTGSNNLVFTASSALNNLRSSDKNAAVQALVRTFTYRNTNAVNPSTSSRAISIAIRDDDGTETESLTVAIVLPPAVTQVTSSNANGTYKLGTTLSIQVGFNQNVTVITTGGTPRLLLETGATDRYATYTSGSGTSTLSFSYTVQAGDLSSDLDYQSTSALELNGGTIRNSSGANAALILPAPGSGSSLGGLKALVVDGVVPVVTAVNPPSGGTYTQGQSITFTVAFSENITVTGTPNLSLNLSPTGTTAAPYVSGSGTNTLTFTYTVNASATGITLGSLNLNAGTLRDPAGNDANLTLNGAGSTSGIVLSFDNTAPTTSNVTAAANGTYIIGENINFTVAFSENVTVTGAPSLPVTLNTGGTVAANYISGTGTSSLVFSYTVVEGNLDTNGVTLGGSIVLNGGSIRDAATNNATLTLNNVASTTGVLVDGIRPNISSVSVPGANTYTVGQTMDFTVVFSEPVTVTSAPTLTLGVSTGGAISASLVNGSGTDTLTFRYFVNASSPSGATITVNGISLGGGAAIRDLPGNHATLTLNNVGSTSGITIIGGGEGPIISGTDTVNGSYGNNLGEITLSSNKPNTTFTALNLPPGVTLSPSGVLTGTPTQAGTYNVRVIARDSDGNTSNSLFTIVINKALLTVKADNKVRAFGVENPTFTATYSGFRDGDGVDTAVTGNPSLSTTATSSTPVGIAAINVTTGDLVSANYSFSFVPGTLTIGSSNQVITILPDSDSVLSSPLNLTAFSSSGLPVSLSILSGNATLNGSVLTLVPGTGFLGSVTIRAFQAGNETFTATEVTRTIQLDASASASDHLINLSSRARITPEANSTLITGFVIGGTEPKSVLLRAIGPTLSSFGIAQPLPNPRLRVYNGAGSLIFENDDWVNSTLTTTFDQVGAFPLPVGSKDSALLISLIPGAYTMHVLGGPDSGIALAEIYDANPQEAYQRLVNISTRGNVDSSADGMLIGGFVVAGTTPKRLLIRGVGPTLGAFGVTGTLADPRLTILRGSTIIAQNNDWGTPQSDAGLQTPASADQIVAAAQATGAFAFTANSKDAAVVVTLSPGAYTAQVNPGNASESGVALVEIYELPQ